MLLRQGQVTGGDHVGLHASKRATNVPTKRSFFCSRIGYSMISAAEEDGKITAGKVRLGCLVSNGAAAASPA